MYANFANLSAVDAKAITPRPPCTSSVQSQRLSENAEYVERDSEEDRTGGHAGSSDLDLDRPRFSGTILRPKNEIASVPTTVLTIEIRKGLCRSRADYLMSRACD
jgi:hypothetical protein